MNRTPIKLLVAAACAAVGAVVISLGRPVPERPAASVLDAGSRASIASRWKTRVDTLRKGEPLVAVLERAGVPREDANRALLSVASLDLRRVRAGTTITTRTSPDSGAAEIVFQMAIDRLVRLRRSAPTVWTESDERLEWKTDTVVVGGEVRSTLTDAIERGAEAFPESSRDDVAYALADVLEYRIDLSRDLQKGDSVRVLLERRVAPNGLVRPGAILAARMIVAGRAVETVRFTNAKSEVEYFDGDGKAMRAGFLRAPLAFRRISSVFGLRKHPILGVWRAHQGLDYAAAKGTEVRALGNGTVIFAGFKGGYGRVVEIRHRNGYVTRYGHLNGFAAGIKRGVSVAISRTIGFVGASGLATAPHLHFEVLVDGKHRDPSKALKDQTGEPIAVAERSAFADLRARFFARLGGAMDGAPVIASVPAANSARGDAARNAGDE